MKRLIEHNYESTCKRGLITDKTHQADFLFKLEEEVKEFFEATIIKKDLEHEQEELADIILVCLNYARHNNWDIEKIMNDKIDKNYER